MYTQYHRQFRGRISNVLFKDIHVVDGPLPFSVFHGFDKEHNVTDVDIENLTYQGRRLTTPEAAKIRMQDAEVVVK